jgi:hypothetical protein
MKPRTFTLLSLLVGLALLPGHGEAWPVIVPSGLFASVALFPALPITQIPEQEQVRPAPLGLPSIRTVRLMPVAHTCTRTTAPSETVIFTSGGNMVEGRYHHRATLLPNGKVLITGGIDDAGNRLASAELYDPAAGAFAATGSMSTVRYVHTSTLLPDGKVLIAGGYTSWGDLSSSAELYDPTTGTFTLTGSMVVGRWSHTATLLPNGKVLIAAGCCTNSAELYDPTTGTFTTTGSTSDVGEQATATLLPNGKVLVVGRDDPGTAPLASADLYDSTSGTFTPTGSMATVRHGHIATLLQDGRVLIAGGNTNSAELYDPTTDTFTPTGSMAWGHYEDTATLLPNGKVLVAGGVNSELYDPAFGKFAITCRIAARRNTHTATLLPSGKVLIVGGSSIHTGHKLASAEIGTCLVDAEPPTGILVINDGAIATTSPSATLVLSANDTGSCVTEMSFSNGGGDWSDWLAYTNSASWSLSSGDGQKTVYGRFKDAASNVSPVVSDTIQLDTDAGPEYRISINDGALFTNKVTVTLTIGAEPDTRQMQVSNDGGFAGVEWEPYASRKVWRITKYGSYVIPRVVYVRYKDASENVSATYQDDIILDVTAPTGSVEAIAEVSGENPPATREKISSMRSILISPSDEYSHTVCLPLVLCNYCTPPTGPANVTLYLQAQDDVSGVADMMISHLANLDCAEWEPYVTTRAWYAPERATMVYVRFRDNAGNVSDVVTDTIIW